MGFSLRYRHIVLLAAFFALARCADMVMEEDELELERPDIQKAGSKTFHWLMTMALLLILPSFSTVLVFAGKYHTGVFLQIVSLVYSFFEAAVLRFPDNDGVENRTSRGTAWFLFILNCITVGFGSLNSGGDWFFGNDSKGKHWITLLGQRTIRIIHKTLSVLVVLTGWVKTCLAPVALFGFCREIHTGQCLAHGIMGSAFIIYGFIYAVALVIPWIRESDHKNSQEFYDSLVMTLWGIVNTFTEHRWGREDWNHGDYQHTSMGIIWWSGGLLGIYLSRGGRRSWIPSLLLIFTGWAMSEHVQKLTISTKVHNLFGLVLMAGGALRIVEISFLLKDARSIPGRVYSFQYIPSFCLILSGVLFMGANEEQLILVLRLKADHSAYILTVSSAAFLIYLWFLSLLELYLKLVNGKSVNLGYRTVEDTPSTEFELEDIEA